VSGANGTWRRRPNVFNFGLLLNSVLGVKPTLVPFTGTGPATTPVEGPSAST